jgi:hypothetical protein
MGIRNYRLEEGYPKRTGELSLYKNRIHTSGTLGNLSGLIGYEFILLRTPTSKGLMISGSLFEGEHLEVMI